MNISKRPRVSLVVGRHIVKQRSSYTLCKLWLFSELKRVAFSATADECKDWLCPTCYEKLVKLEDSKHVNREN
jgi:hypothetical protein